MALDFSREKLLSALGGVQYSLYCYHGDLWGWVVQWWGLRKQGGRFCVSSTSWVETSFLPPSSQYLGPSGLGAFPAVPFCLKDLPLCLHFVSHGTWAFWQHLSRYDYLKILGLLWCDNGLKRERGQLLQEGQRSSLGLAWDSLFKC